MSGRLSDRKPWEQSLPRSESVLSYAELDAQITQAWYDQLEKERRSLRNRLKRLYHRITRYGQEGTTNSIVFIRLGKYQFNIKRSWEGFGLRTWPRFYNGHQKRALHFGIGYISWRIA